MDTQTVLGLGLFFFFVFLVTDIAYNSDKYTDSRGHIRWGDTLARTTMNIVFSVVATVVTALVLPLL